MPKSMGLGLMLFAGLLSTAVVGQEKRKPLDPKKAHTSYSFSVRAGGEPFRFQVQLDNAVRVTGVSVFREGEPTPFQTLSSCDKNLSMELTEYDDERELLNHADLNFDGFEDLELLQDYDDHNATLMYCIYVWDQKQGRFRYEPGIPNINPVADPDSKTIRVHQDWQGGAYSDTTYHWNGAKFEVIEEANAPAAEQRSPTKLKGLRKN